MITMYSKAGCPECVKAKTLLDFYNVEYEEIKIDEVSEARTFVVQDGHRSVPQFYIGEQIFVHGSFAGLNKMNADEIRARIEELNGN